VHGNSHLQNTLVECGWGATRKKDSYFKRKYESLVPRRGKKKALVAVGHKIIIAVYHVIKNKERYQEPVLHDNNHRKQKKQMKYHLRKLKDLGIEINETGGRFFTEAEKCSIMKLIPSA
jgi:transposase